MSLVISPSPVSSAGLTFGTITRVQSASGNTGNAASTATSVTLTFGANLTVGNLVVYCACGDSNQGIRLVEPDGSIGLWTDKNNSTNSCQTSLGYLYVETASNAVLTASNGLGGAGTFNGGIVAVEYSGAKLRPDVFPQSNTSLSGTASTTSISTTGSNDLLIAGFGARVANASENTSWLSAITNNYSIVKQTSSFNNVIGTDREVAIAERIVSSPGSYSTSGTVNGNLTWVTLSFAFVGD